MNEFYLSTEFAVENTREPINQQIYKFLKKAIIECRLQPGDPLSENEVSNKFKVRISRQPVREALIKLAENDFVVIEPKKTTKVAKISKKDILQGAEMRMAIEGYCIRKSCDIITPEIIQKLHENIEQQKKVADQYDVHEHFRLDDEFHSTLIHASGLDRAWNMVEGLKASMDRIRYLSLEYEVTPMIVTSSAHQKILEALERKDAEAAHQALYEHISATRDQLSEVIQKCRAEWFRE